MHGDRFVLAFLTVLLLRAGTLEAAVATGTKTTDPIETSLGLSKAARAVLATDPSRAAALAETAGRLVEQSPGEGRRRALAMAMSRWLQGEAALRLNNPEVARPLLADAFATVSTQDAGSDLQADILVARARLESTTSQVQNALADYLAAFEIYKNDGNKHQQAVTLQDIGLLYHVAGDDARSLSYYEQSRATYTGVPILDLSIANNRADSLEALGRYREAEAGYLSALKVAGALKSPSLEAQILSNLAVAQISDHRYAAARSSVDRGLRLARGSAAVAILPTLLSTDAQLDLREGRLADARATIESIDETHSDDAASERDEWVHRTKYEVYKAEGRDQDALREFEAYQKIQSGHQILMASANTALMAARFDFENQNDRIAALKTGELRRDIALTRLRARQGQILLLGLLLVGAATIVFLFIYQRILRISRNRTREINTQLSQTNLKLEHALQAKTQFLATTSHEIRTPLNGVLGLTEVLLAGDELPNSVRQRVSLIHGAGEAMRTLVDDLLDMSKMDAAEIVLQRDVVNLPALLSEIRGFWTSHAEGAGLTMSLDVADAPTMIVEDARRLRQILSNLLSNAVKFTSAGSIELSARAETFDDGEHLLISVADSGIGIPEASREMIFEKFTQLDTSITRKYSGTGLGLSIARNLARTMGGDIAVRSSPAGGAEFVVTLPLVRSVVAATSRPDRSPALQPSSDLSVMVVEPNPIRQGALRALLERRVETLSFTATIREAIDDLETSGAHIVITSFPKDGQPLHDKERRNLTELGRACQCIGVFLVVTIDTVDMDAAASLRCLGASFLERPVTANKLFEHIEGLHDWHGTEPAMRA